MLIIKQLFIFIIFSTFLFSSDPAIQIPNSLRTELGDVNDDGSIDILDVVLVVNIILGQMEYTDEQFILADLNQDSLVNILDIVLLIDLILFGAIEQSTWEIISEDIFTPRCANCHYAGSFYSEQSGLVMTEDVAYQEMINMPPVNQAAFEAGLVMLSNEGGLLGIQLSYIWEKINIADQEHFFGDHPLYGELMPLGGPYLNNGQLSFIEEWILNGAPETGIVADDELLADTSMYYAPPFVVLDPPDFGLQLHLGPFEVPPGGEREMLSYIDPGYDEDVYIKQVEISMRPGSHHFIAYTFDTSIPWYFVPEEDSIRDFYDENGEFIVSNFFAMQYHKFVAGTQWPSLNYHFPQGVALRFPHEYGLDMNSHYLNYTDESYQGEVYMNLHFEVPGEVEHVAEILMLNNDGLSLPPGVVTTVEATYTFNNIIQMHDVPHNTEQITIFQLFTHAHEHMLRFDIEIIDMWGNAELVYTALDWQHPPILELNDPIELTAGMSVKLIATYDNWTDEYLNFGLLSVDEMMILFGYFYID